MSTDNRIRVRLVPKTKQGESLTMYVPTIDSKQAKRFSPDPDRAFAARFASFSIGLHSEISPKNSVAGVLEIDKFESMFGAVGKRYGH
uniref:Uncharacterized protein n=1 Tax=Candidatus Kentrum sp. MB TaxID=2138164 RepID=A0A450XPX2_9GAMM|nr:MAG: hypothetical protein BECKMB1821G_GA0114241_108212 [Candidatus Kentron sp. MB]VFK34717.1 MAG: hypothetical protein BECKMB1821I_GA0114274_108112 [Candidatus Kentron sp. MB]VFK76963.1 MAG: hypothetical protein BECKMB1821H_GA0114242_108611 [Candidatus Kentron sp. MB]